MKKPSEQIREMGTRIQKHLSPKNDFTYVKSTVDAIIQYLDEQYEAEQANIDRIFQVGQTAQPPYNLTDKDI